MMSPQYLDGAMTPDNEAYLQPTGLCDFDRNTAIKANAMRLVSGCVSGEEKFRQIFDFVKELPYGLEDWDVTASETLAKGWGMCSGKTNLLVAMLRSVAIPSRYRILRIRAEINLWQWAILDQKLAQSMGDVPAEQDHVDCEVWLENWSACDPARDTLLERGMVALGIPLEREIVIDREGNPACMTLAVFDDWAEQRQSARRFRESREEIFARVNEQFERIRSIGKGEGQSGTHNANLR